MPSWKQKYLEASNHAHFGRNEEFISSCDTLLSHYPSDKDLILNVSSLFLGYGFLKKSCESLAKGLLDFPADPDLLLLLANAKLQSGQIGQCQEIYQDLLTRFPNSPQVLRNLIFFSEYLPFLDNPRRLEIAKKWGKLSIESSGGHRPRPTLKNISSKKIKLGYVSADFCQHTVGILIKHILATHDKDKFEIFCYSNSRIVDVVTEKIRTYSHFKDVIELSDSELAALIRSDGIDILIDLSGHTGGSRLSTFAYRPAPVQVSWLGYYATTGLETIDGILLDRWHIYNDIHTQFTEPIISLPTGRWCYFPAINPAPLISNPPSLESGYITFGSFNNTLKYNQYVYAVWAKILVAVPNSKLILKWRTFHDAEFRQYVMEQFQFHGIDSSRIELRGPSFHIDMLAQYKDIDIALDPFPFSGGVTSCEALYMGLPVITWPQNRVVSRQTYAFLSSIGHAELAVNNEEEYVQEAIKLANSPQKLIEYRQTLRETMLNSPLMRANQFTNSFEVALVGLLNQHQQTYL